MRDPFDEMQRIHREMDELFLELYRGPAIGANRPSASRPSADVCYAEDMSWVSVTFEVAGADPAALKVAISGRTLTIEGRRAEPPAPPGGRYYHHMEIEYGPFRRNILLPFDVDAERAEGEYRDGILTLTLPSSKGEVAAPEARVVRVVIEGRDIPGTSIGGF